MIENEITKLILKCAFKVHTELGAGLLESAYQECLFFEMKKMGLQVEKEKPIPLIYNEVKMAIGYRIDLFVNNKIVVEIKSVKELNDLHIAQVITYLKLSKSKVGLLLNFNVPSLKQGIKRIVNNY